MRNTLTNGVATRNGKRFTTGSLRFLTNKAGKMSARSIAKVLHRTEKSVRRKAERLGLSLKVA
jgi:hypothetical protein